MLYIFISYADSSVLAAISRELQLSTFTQEVIRMVATGLASGHVEYSLHIDAKKSRYWLALVRRYTVFTG